jgi:ATP-dependent HslUV protease subunit HslV
VAAQAAATVLIKHTALSAAQIAAESLNTAADLCVFTNAAITMEEI